MLEKRDSSLSVFDKIKICRVFRKKNTRTAIRHTCRAYHTAGSLSRETDEQRTVRVNGVCVCKARGRISPDRHGNRAARIAPPLAYSVVRLRSCVFGRARTRSDGFAHERGQPVSRRWQSLRDQFRSYTYSRRSVIDVRPSLSLAFGVPDLAYRSHRDDIRVRVTSRAYDGARASVEDDSSVALAVVPEAKKRNSTRGGLYAHNRGVWCLLRESCGCTTPEGKYLCLPPTFESTRLDSTRLDSRRPRSPPATALLAGIETSRPLARVSRWP